MDYISINQIQIELSSHNICYIDIKNFIYEMQQLLWDRDRFGLFV